MIVPPPARRGHFSIGPQNHDEASCGTADPYKHGVELSEPAMAKFGPCHICGVLSKLSFEHVPPRAAYNDQRVFEADIKALVDGKWDGQARPTPGKWVQRGAGKETLCERCNNDTGGWYGKAYVGWARQGVELIERSGGKLSPAYPYHIYPLRAFKQVVVMFCSACGPSLQGRFSDVTRFVLQKETRHMPHGLKVFAHLLDPTKSERRAGMTGVLKEGSQRHVFAEIAFPPFGFLLTGDEKPIHPQLLDITFMGQYDFFLHQTLFLKLPVLPVNTWLPGDFRTKDEIKKSLLDNKYEGRVELDVKA
jgi:hypothetical protein